MSEIVNDLNDERAQRMSPAYLRVSAAGNLQRAVAYLRVSAPGLDRITALVEQQNALQRFADDAGFKIGRWYIAGDDGAESDVTALSRLLGDVATEGCEFNVVLVWNYSRLSRNAAGLAEVKRRLLEHGVQLVSAADTPAFGALARQLAELTGTLDDEATA